MEGEKEDLQRKLTILQDDLEKSEERGNEHRKQAEEKAASLDETERLAVFHFPKFESILDRIIKDLSLVSYTYYYNHYSCYIMLQRLLVILFKIN